MTEETNDNQADVRPGPGCFVALVLLLVAVAGLSRGLFLPDGDGDAPLKMIAGGPSRLIIPTDLATVNGLCRIVSPRAMFQFTDDETPVEVPVEGLNQDTWGNDTEIDIVTVKGVPVTTGRDDVKMEYRLDLSRGSDWPGRSAKLTLSSRLHYPFIDIDDVLVGSVLGSLSYEERVYDFETELDVLFVADKNDEAAARETEKILDFAFVGLIVLAVLIFIFFGAKSKSK